MDGPRKNYYRIRRVAAAELQRLHAAGLLVHPDAIEWAEIALAGKDDVGGRAPAVARSDILALLAKYPTTGLTIEAAAAHFGETEKRMGSALYVLRKHGQVQSVKHIGRVYYFPSRAALDAQMERLARERDAVELKQARARYAVVKARREERAKAEGRTTRAYRVKSAAPAAAQAPRSPKASAPAPAEKPAKAAAQPPAMRAAPSIATPAKRQVEVTGLETARRIEAVQYPPHRFWVDPKYTVPGGFREEFQRLLGAGRAEA